MLGYKNQWDRLKEMVEIFEAATYWKKRKKRYDLYTFLSGTATASS